VAIMPALPPLVFVLAAARGGVIGRGGQLPWDFPEDREHFYRLTRGHTVIMGRRTFEETGEPLPERRNLVVSRRPGLALPGAEVVATVDTAIALARQSDPEPRVIGGAEIFRAALPLATRIELTEIDLDVEGDAAFVFPREGWLEAQRRVGSDPRLSFVTLERRG
jgi:dihydrofolate reductase